MCCCVRSQCFMGTLLCGKRKKGYDTKQKNCCRYADPADVISAGKLLYMLMASGFSMTALYKKSVKQTIVSYDAIHRF